MTSWDIQQGAHIFIFGYIMDMLTEVTSTTHFVDGKNKLHNPRDTVIITLPPHVKLIQNE